MPLYPQRSASVVERGPQGIQGPAGPIGPPGAAANVTSYPINGVAGITVSHGLPYAPRVWILDPSGAVVTTDVIHAPGQVTAMFAVPFVGMLYLG